MEKVTDMAAETGPSQGGQCHKYHSVDFQLSLPSGTLKPYVGAVKVWFKQCVEVKVYSLGTDGIHSRIGTAAIWVIFSD